MTVDDEIRAALADYQPPRASHFSARHATAIARRRRTRRRVAGTLGSAAVLLVLVVAVATLHADHRAGKTRTGGPPPTTPPPDTTRPGEDPHEAQARAKARDLLAAFTPPPAAVPVSGADDPFIDGAMATWTPNAVDRHQSWVMAGNVYSVYQALVPRLPATAQVAGVEYPKGLNPPNPSGPRNVVIPTPRATSVSITLTGPDTTDASPDFDSSTATVSLIRISGSRTAIRADAWADWSPTRRAGPRVGAGQQYLTITTTFDPPIVAKPRTLRTTVTDRKRIDSAAKALDALPLPIPRQAQRLCATPGRLVPLSGGLNSSFMTGSPAGPHRATATRDDQCETQVPRCVVGGNGGTEVLRFSAAPGAPADATATLEYRGEGGTDACDHVVVLWVRGQRPIVLQGGSDRLAAALWYIAPRLVPLPTTTTVPRHP